MWRRYRRIALLSMDKAGIYSIEHELTRMIALVEVRHRINEFVDQHLGHRSVVSDRLVDNSLYNLVGSDIALSVAEA